MTILDELAEYARERVEQAKLRVSLEEIKAKLEERGLSLGMTDYSHLKNVNFRKNKDENE